MQNCADPLQVTLNPDLEHWYFWFVIAYPGTEPVATNAGHSPQLTDWTIVSKANHFADFSSPAEASAALVTHPACAPVTEHASTPAATSPTNFVE